MGVRERAVTYLLDLIKSYPGRMADFYIYQVSKEFHLKPKTVSEYLRILHQSNEIVEKHARFYPRDFKFEDEEKKEQILPDWLRAKASQDVTPETQDVTPETQKLIRKDESTVTSVTKKYTSVTTQDVTPMTPLEPSTKFLLVYDMKADIEDSERRAIYRRLNRAYHQILKEGRHALRIQMSVWEIESREDAYRLASCLPSDKTRIKIYRIVGEES
jgi:hypothetical protein